MTKQRPLCPRACAVPAVLFALLFCASFCTAALPPAQLSALNDFYEATDGDNWFFNFRWGADDPCDDGWFGVTCNAAGTSVVALELADNDVAGIIPESIGALVDLTILDLFDNFVNDPIPEALGTLANLQYLDLEDNSLETLPSSMSGLTSLETLYLSDNFYAGSIPSVLGQITSLVFLDLGDNILSGEIPGPLASLSNLETLRLYDNFFVSITPSIALLTSLKELDLEDNLFSGPFPGNLALLSNLEELDAGDNKFNVVTADVSAFTAIKDLNIDHNLFTSLPNEIWELVTLVNFDASDNLIDGTIPPAISNLVNLVDLDLDDNLIDGPLPDAFANLVNLESFDMDDNQLTGPLPDSFKFLTKLDYLDLDDNMLSGKIPPFLGDLTTLTFLSLHDNNFSGVIPESLANLVSLQTLFLENNNFVGAFPAFLSRPPSFSFDARNNRFTCPLPTWCDDDFGDGSCGPCIVCTAGNGGDIDRDNVCGVDDNCPIFANPQQLDSDFPACDGSGEGDPHFVGFHHQLFDFFGLPGQIYNLLSDSALQVNTFLDRQQFGPHSFLPGPVMKIISFFTADHTVIVNSGGLFRDDVGFVSFDGVKMKDGDKIVVDGLTVSFFTASGSAKDYGMKGDDQIAAICHFTLEGLFDFQLFLIENHFNPFLPNVPATSKYYRRFIDFNAALLDQERDCHGILGQTARLQSGDRERSLKDWKIEGTEEDYKVTDGLLGKDFTFNKFTV